MLMSLLQVSELSHSTALESKLSCLYNFSLWQLYHEILTTDMTC